MEATVHQPLSENYGSKEKLTEEKSSRITIEEIDPEEINKLWDSLPEMKSSF